MKEFLVKDLFIESLTYEEFKDNENRFVKDILLDRYQDSDNTLFIRGFKFLKDRVIIILEWRSY